MDLVSLLKVSIYAIEYSHLACPGTDLGVVAGRLYQRTQKTDNLADTVGVWLVASLREQPEIGRAHV